MTLITMRRKALPDLQKGTKKWDNPSLFFDKGFKEWNTEKDGERGENIGKHLQAVCEIPVSPVYTAAYRRWLKETADKNCFAHWFGQLDGTRLFIGLGMPHVLEAQVCRHPTYGIPYIPGSALKGLARAEARRYAKEQKENGLKEYNKVIDILFGPELNNSENTEADTGYLIFHDAWWIPKGEEGNTEDTPYVPEIVTVHAVEYYKNKGEGAPHPDMESPNPNQQLAVQGSFYFVIEGVVQWAKLGRQFLTIALEAEGIGGKVAAGYGYFEEEAGHKKKREAREEAERIRNEKAEKKERDRIAQEKADEKARVKIEDFNNLSEAERFVCELDEAVEDYLKNKVLKGKKDAVSQRINRIIKSKGWSGPEKEMGFQIVQCAYTAILSGKKLRKKLEKAKTLLAAKDSE